MAKNKVGRPSIYSDELAAAICGEIAVGRSLRSICAEDGMPATATIFRWLGENQKFRDQYAKAKQEQAEAFAEELLDIADDGENDWMERIGKDGQSIGWQLNGEHVQRSRLRVDTRKWLMSKMLPKKYGEKLDVEHDAGPNLRRLIIGD